MKIIRVVAAIIKVGNEILATQRGYGKFKGLWEFPGGKIQDNETQEQALIREIKEELSADIKIIRHFDTLEHKYEDLHVILDTYVCEFVSEAKFKLNEHLNYKYLNKDNLFSVQWLEADYSLVEKIKLKLL